MPEEITKDWLKIIKVIQETPDTKTLRIELKKPIDFISGQFVMAGLNIKENEKESLVKRAFSIASSPLEKNHIDLTFNIVPEGKFSPHLYSVKEGDLVYIEGPYGKFNFSPDVKDNFVFLGAGTGITPLMSMIKFSMEKKLKNKKTLIYSVKKPENIVYNNELSKLGKSGLNLFITITRPEGNGWTGLKGRIDGEMIKKCVPDLKRSVFYMCGPPEMIEGTVKILENMGIQKEKINREQW